MSTTPSIAQGPVDGPSVLYPYYYPTKAAPVIFLVLFAISGILFTFQTIRFKSWRFTFLFSWGASLYVAGYAMRIVSITFPQDLGILIATNVLLFLAPPVFQGANYLILGRMLYYVPYLSPLHPGRVTSTFVILDVAVGVIVAQGASRLARWEEPDQVRIGQSLLKASLLLQVALFLGFILLQVIFQRRCLRKDIWPRNLRSAMIVQYISNFLILARNIFRVVEAFLPSDSLIRRNEAFDYVFDATPILINSILLNAYFPAVFLPQSNKIYVSSDGRTARKGPGWKDRRNFFLTVVDPFDLSGQIRGETNQEKFWDHESEHPIVAGEQENSPRKRSAASAILDPFDIGGVRASFSKPKEVKTLSSSAA